MSLRTPVIALFRLVLLSWLMFGLCLQPALAATCAIDDVRSALGNDAGALVTSLDADGATNASDCCSSPLCSDCCLHAAGSLHQFKIGVASLMPMRHVSPRVDEFRPRDYPVDIRPPIRR